MPAPNLPPAYDETEAAFGDSDELASLASLDSEHEEADNLEQSESAPFLQRTAEQNRVNAPPSVTAGPRGRNLPEIPQWMLQHHDFDTQASRPPIQPPPTRSPANDVADDQEDTELRNEMEFFEVMDPEQDAARMAGSTAYHMYTRASEVSLRFAKKLSSTFVAPVQRILIDPVVYVLNRISTAIDSFLARFGNPLLLRRLFYVVVVAVVTIIAVSSGLFPNGITGGALSEIHDPRQLRAILHETINADAIKANMEYLTAVSNTAGTSGDFTLARHIENLFDSYGLHLVRFDEETVFLTAPNTTESGMEFQLLGTRGQPNENDIKYSATLWEKSPYENPTEAQNPPRPFHAMSASGSVTAPIVYLGYGTKEEYAFLNDKVSVKGAIVVIKNGKMALGLKLRLAQEHGAVGAVTFSEHATADAAWPEGPNYSDESIERLGAGVAAIYPGDILTPGWSATLSSQAINYNEAPNVPRIPSVPVSWKDIKPFLDSLKGQGVRVDNDPNWSNNGKPDIGEWWTGDADRSDAVMAHLKNDPIMSNRHEIWNVFAEIEGVEQGDQAVIIGAQRDSFCYGAIKPMSGTAVMLEVARIFAILRNELGWKPSRSILFASWDATEQNCAGSVEWVESNAQQLEKAGLAYINLDAAISGTKLKVQGHPFFERAVREVLRDVADPVRNTSSLADNWSQDHITPFVDMGDYIAFTSWSGIPSLQLSFEAESGFFPRGSCLDSFEWLQKFADPSFMYHTKLVEVIAFLILRLSDEPLVPFDISALGHQLHDYTRDAERYAHDQPGWSDGLLDFNPLIVSADSIVNRGIQYDEWMKQWLELAPQGESPMLTAHRWGWNQRALELDKYFLTRNGMASDRRWYKHVVFGPQLWHPVNGDYQWTTLPAIRDAIENGNWKLAQAQISQAADLIEQAGSRFVM